MQRHFSCILPHKTYYPHQVAYPYDDHEYQPPQKILTGPGS